MNDLDLMERVHKVQLEMALEVKRICQKHNIKYFIIAGTLLGAVRHNGFIPWDDDLDIGMIREEYERFIYIAKRELNKEYFLQTWDTDPNFALPIAKLRKNGTKFVEQNSSKSNSHSGIYIDIFPFDNVPKSNIRKRIHNQKTYLLKRVILVKQGYEVWNKNEHFKKFIYKSIRMIAKLFSLSKCKNMLYNEMIKYNAHKSDYIVTFGGAYGYYKETIKHRWAECLTNIYFDEHEFSCPEDYRDYLTYFYGDYMTPPPKEKRYNRHKIIEIEFGDETK